MNTELIRVISLFMFIITYFITDLSYSRTEDLKEDLSRSQLDDKRLVTRLREMEKGNSMLGILCWIMFVICLVTFYVFS